MESKGAELIQCGGGVKNLRTEKNHTISVAVKGSF